MMNETADAEATWRGDGRPLPVTISSLVMANVALFAVYQAILLILLPMQVEAIDPASKVANLALVTGVGAVFAAIFNPLAGALSDNTRSRFGRRAPWMLGAGVCAFVAMNLLGAARDVIWIIVAFCLVQMSMNAFQAPLTAAMPERVPPFRRGIASSFIGLNMPIGSILGAAIASHFATRTQTGYFVVAAGFLAVAVLFVFASPDRPSLAARVAPTAGPRDWRGPLAAFKSRDFTWTFLSRLAIILSFFLVAGYQLYLLQDYIRLPPGTTPAVAIVGITTVMTIAMAIATLAGGWASDLLKRRRIFVFVAALAMGAALLAPLAAPTLAGMYVFAVILGAGFGCYLSVDAALITQVLPDGDTAGRDLGVLNIANAGPQIAAPFVAALVIQNLGGYPALFVTAAILAVVSGVAIMGVRGVR